LANKDKLLANAQKFLSKGQVPKAIGEYQKLVESFPKDVRNRQKLAELLSRDKRNEEALHEYEVVAKHYTETGFYLKAIAVFKQMQKIEPSRVDIYHRLAELNEKQGLVGNALTEYRNLVSFYDKNAMHGEAIDVLEKMAELDPENLNVSAKIAECYMATGQNEEALEKFQGIVAPLIAKGEHTKIIKLYDRFLDICPEEGTSRLPLAQALLGNGSVEKAIQILKTLLKHSPEDLGINRCLTDAYVAGQDFVNAKLTLKHLLKQNEGDLDLREYFVRVLLEAKDAEQARDSLEEWKDAFFQGDRVDVLLGFYEDLNELIPGDRTVADTLAVIYEAIGETSKLKGLGEDAMTEDAAVETADDAILDDVIDDVETLEMVGEEVAPDIEVPALDSDDDAPVAQEASAVATGLELDLDLDLDIEQPAEATVDEPPDAAEEVAEAAAEDEVEVEMEIDLDGMGEFDIEFEEDDASTAHASVQEQAETTETVADSDDETFSDDASEEPFSEVAELDADLDLEEDAADRETTPEVDEGLEQAVDDSSAVAASVLEGDEVADVMDASLADLPLDAEAGFEVGRDEMLVAPDEELDALEVDAPSEIDEAAEVEEVAEREEPEEVAEFEELEEVAELEELEEVAELEELEEVAELEELEEVAELEELAPDGSKGSPDFAASVNVEAELEEAEFYLQQGLYDDATRVVQTLLEYRPDMPELLVKMDEINQAREAHEEESDSRAFVDLMSDIQDDDLLAATDFLDAFGSDTAVDDVLSQKTVSELDSADTESHYNLGIAYKEMGLYDDAIAEFDKASQDPSRTIDCLTLTGQCHLEAGEMDAAMAAFKKGLAHEGLSAEAGMTLNFEIGMLHQMNGQLLEALESFQKVAEKDSFFREVSDLIKNLRRELGLDDSDDDDGPQGNRDRVSYV